MTDTHTHDDAPPRVMVLDWTGAEIRALREARRMSIREFAAHLGVSDRMISKWEARPDMHPRLVNQAALDTSLARVESATLQRFTLILNRSELERRTHRVVFLCHNAVGGLGETGGDE